MKPTDIITTKSGQSVEIWQGDCLESLRAMPDNSVHCVVTSPPYWGLRDYGTGTWEGGDPECDHKGEPFRTKANINKNWGEGYEDKKNAKDRQPLKSTCPKCGAIRVDKQIGLEDTPEQFIEKLVEVFREVRRVLREDGTCWVNMGDGYAANRSYQVPDGKHCDVGNSKGANAAAIGLKPKDLIGQPWMLAFALRADGWYLRQDIIWHKPNPMPESVRDRCTKAHEYIFLLAKGQWKTRIVQFADLPSERFHLGKYVGPDRPDAGPSEFCIALATAIFDSAQRQQQFALPPFYAQEWKQLPDGSDSDFVRGLPVEHRPAAVASRFLSADASAKEFLRQLDSLRVALPDSNQFLVGGASAISLDSPVVHADAEGTIAVHHAGQISKIDFAHERIIVSSPMTCKYFYDQDAILEPVSPNTNKRISQDLEKQIDSHRAHGGAKSNGPMKAVSRKAKGGKVGREKNNSSMDAALSVQVSARNKRSVWTVTTRGYPEAHFATFPPKLIEPCIKAGCPAGGTVLDPFGGSFTTAEVALKLGCSAVMCELNPEYIEMGKRRISAEAAQGKLFT